MQAVKSQRAEDDVSVSSSVSGPDPLTGKVAVPKLTPPPGSRRRADGGAEVWEEVLALASVSSQNGSGRKGDGCVGRAGGRAGGAVRKQDLEQDQHDKQHSQLEQQVLYAPPRLRHIDRLHF